MITTTNGVINTNFIKISVKYSQNDKDVLYLPRIKTTPSQLIVKIQKNSQGKFGDVK
jgi:hypothetical protein